MESTSPIDTLAAALSTRYEFVREIGRGGMAAVFLARDIRHDRLVAVKVLDPELAASIGTDRFLAEIRITARLQHPNLLALFDSGEVNGVPYYVMPFVEGESLRTRLSRERQLPVEDAVLLAIRIAAGLEYAHRHDVVHRDLKPENILLRDGEPLIADFGIALAVSNAGANRLTQTGLSLGTPQYMSPEQAAAERVINGRTDIFALGAVLYEMLAGEPPHSGPTAQVTLARVATEPARSIRLTRPSVPPAVDAAILKALAKTPADRWSTAKDFGSALSSGLDDGDRPRLMSGRSRLRVVLPIATALVAGTAGGLALRSNSSDPADESYSFVLPLPDSAAVSTGYGASGGDVAISRDGRMIAYAAGPAGGGEASQGIWIRPLNQLTPRPVRGANRGGSPRFSPDGTQLLYSYGSDLYLVRLDGSSPTRITTNASSYDWIDSRTIVFSRGSTFWVSRGIGSPQLRRLTIGDTTSHLLVGPDSARHILGVGLPRVLEGGKQALVTIWKGERGSAEPQLGLVSLADGRLTELGIPGSNPVYKRGFLFFVKADGGLYALPFQPSRGAVSGPETLVAPSVLVKLSWWADFDVADNGTVVYMGGSDFRRRLVLVDRSGIARPLVSNLHRYLTPRVSPDGRRVAVEVGTMDGFNIWSLDVGSRTFGAVTHDGRSARTGGWLGGDTVLYLQLDSTLRHFRAVAQVGGDRDTARVIASWDDNPADVDAEAGTIAFRVGGAIAVAPAKDPTKRRSVVPAAARAGVMRLSRDGALLAYESFAVDPVEVFARGVADGTAIQISSGGGQEPVWSFDGRQVFYRSGSYVLAATIERGPLRVTRRDTLFRDTFARGSIASNYDVMPNGQFVMVQIENPDVFPTVLVNWRGRTP